MVKASANTVDIRVWEKLCPDMPEKTGLQNLDALELTCGRVAEEVDFGYRLAGVVVPDT